MIFIQLMENSDFFHLLSFAKFFIVCFSLSFVIMVLGFCTFQIKLLYICLLTQTEKYSFEKIIILNFLSSAIFFYACL